jgi:hypothetical protein
MSAFPQLSNADIDNIIAYTSEPKLKLLLQLVVLLRFLDWCSDNGVLQITLLGALALVMLVLVVMFFKITFCQWLKKWN